MYWIPIGQSQKSTGRLQRNPLAPNIGARVPFCWAFLEAVSKRTRSDRRSRFASLHRLSMSDGFLTSSASYARRHLHGEVQVQKHHGAHVRGANGGAQPKIDAVALQVPPERTHEDGASRTQLDRLAGHVSEPETLFGEHMRAPTNSTNHVFRCFPIQTMSRVVLGGDTLTPSSHIHIITCAPCHAHTHLGQMV